MKNNVEFGIGTWEKLLREKFPFLETTRPNNKGYDFLFGSLRVDAKCSSTVTFSDGSVGWCFSTSNNQLADCFLCGGFETREDSLPKHVWLIPRGSIYPRKTVKVYGDKMCEWEPYEIQIDGFL
jgi:hypothetical protein